MSYPLLIYYFNFSVWAFCVLLAATCAHSQGGRHGLGLEFTRRRGDGDLPYEMRRNTPRGWRRRSCVFQFLVRHILLFYFSIIFSYALTTFADSLE